MSRVVVAATFTLALMVISAGILAVTLVPILE